MSGGYFSPTTTAPATWGFFNTAVLQHGGDIGDWASWTSIAESGTVAVGQEDAFNAFGRPGLDGILSKDDLLVMAALGFSLTPAGAAVLWNQVSTSRITWS